MAQTLTPNYQLRKYAQGDHPGAAALNANWENIDEIMAEAAAGIATLEDASVLTLTTEAGFPNSRRLQGTANQVVLTENAGDLVLSLPQNIHTAATPQFAGMTLTGLLAFSPDNSVDLTAVGSRPRDIRAGRDIYGVTATLSGLTPTHVLFAGTGGLVSGDAGMVFDPGTDRLTLGSDHTLRINSSVGQPFVLKTSFSTNSGTDNPTLGIGYNFTGLLSNGDNRINTAVEAFSTELEMDYNNGSNRQLEWNFNWRSADGLTYRRGVIYTINYTTNNQEWQFSGYQHSWMDNTAGTTRLLINSSGHVAVNQPSPSVRFEVLDASAAQMRLVQGATKYCDFQVNSSDGSLSISTASAAAIKFGGHLTPTTDSVLDLGATALRWRDIYCGEQFLGQVNSAGSPTYSWQSNPTDGFYQAAAGDISVSIAGTRRYALQASVFYILNDTSSFSLGASQDCNFGRDAANVFYIKNGGAAQALRVYGTTADPKYLEATHQGSYAVLKTNDATDLYIQTIGSANISLSTNSSTRWNVIGATGHLSPQAGNTYDFGDATNTVRTIYAGTSVLAGPSEATFYTTQIAAFHATDASVVARSTTNNVEIAIYATATSGLLSVGTNHPLELRTNNAARLTISADGTAWTIATATSITLPDACNFVFNATTGTKFGTAVGQKMSWWNAAPIVQPAHIADPAGGGTVDAEARTAINAINALLAATGLTAAA